MCGLSPSSRSPSCFPGPDRTAFEDALVRAVWDAFPVSPGHEFEKLAGQQDPFAAYAIIHIRPRR
jgi:hypothetical protein